MMNMVFSKVILQIMICLLRSVLVDRQLKIIISDLKEHYWSFKNR